MSKRIKLLNERETVLLESAQPQVYREVADGPDLSVHFYFPKAFREGEPRPLILFFNSGAWDRGSVIQFAPQALYYVDRGAICGLVDYRNRATHPQANPIDSILDGSRAIRFCRHHSEQLHVDPQRIVAFGAGAGANIAAAAAMKSRIPPEVDDFSLSDPQPNAAVLFSMIIDIEKGSHAYEQFDDMAQARMASLSRYIAPDLPPMLLIHGTADRLIPIEEVRDFVERVKKKRSPIELVEFEGRDGNFFNFNTDPVSYEASLATANAFLERNGVVSWDSEADEGSLISWRANDF